MERQQELYRKRTAYPKTLTPTEGSLLRHASEGSEPTASQGQKLCAYGQRFTFAPLGASDGPFRPLLRLLVDEPSACVFYAQLPLSTAGLLGSPSGSTVPHRTAVLLREAVGLDRHAGPTKPTCCPPPQRWTPSGWRCRWLAFYLAVADAIQRIVACFHDQNFALVPRSTSRSSMRTRRRRVRERALEYGHVAPLFPLLD